MDLVLGLLNCSRLPADSRTLTRNAGRKRALAGLTFAVLLLALATSTSSPVAGAQNTVFNIPPVKIPLEVKGQPIAITASATLTISARNRDAAVLGLVVTGDLSDLQRNLTQLLSSQLDKDDRCGESLTIQNATLTPAQPAGIATVQLHYARRACVKVFGKQESKTLIGGDAQIQIKLTPEIEKDSSQLRLAVDVVEVRADGSLGELLRSGELGNSLREKIRNAILSALQKGTDLRATLPPAAQGYVSIQDVEFKDAGDGRLLVVLAGEVHLTQTQLQTLTSQVKERMTER